MSDLLKEAIADAKAVRETALQNAKMALEEAFTPHLKNMLSAKLSEDDEEEDSEEMARDMDMDDEENDDNPVDINIDADGQEDEGYDMSRDDEEEMLDEAFDLEDNSRLSCQLIMDESLDGLKVKLAYYGD